MTTHDYFHPEEPPWWHRALEERVERIEQSGTPIEVAVLAQQVRDLQESIRTLRNTILVIAPTLGAMAAYITQRFG